MFSHLLSVEQHAVDLLDGVVGSLLRLEVDEAVPLRVAVGGILKKYMIFGGFFWSASRTLDHAAEAFKSTFCPGCNA
jgi:hypothetical protein